MTDNLNTALSLLGVGMITVFLVLALVVIVGNLLIDFVNKFVPAEVKPSGKGTAISTIESSKLEAIKSAIHQLSDGKAEVKKIEKV
ncbi:MAG: hypothetical protein JXQ96_05065 [Cyclobacteriaceae bacterium]